MSLACKGVLQMMATHSGRTAPETPLYSRIMELLVSYHASPSIQVRNQLVQLNRGLVRKIAHRVAHQCGEPYEDLEQIGYLGLISAIERFNPAQGCAFSSFAVPYIRGELLHFLRDRAHAIKIPRRLQQLNKEGQESRSLLMNSLGRQPNDQEIADSLNVSVHEWRSSRLASKNRIPLSLDAAVCQQVDSPVTLGDTLLDARYQTLQNIEEDQIQLQQALLQLEDKTREVIEFVFLKQLSRKEVAERIGISPMTVTRRIQKGIQQLVSLLQSPVLQTDP
ncbi:MAG TPA: sigma-70 family RNA polymerase sigma factor [Candidatus Caenarcaniphilales bacterium]